MRIVLALILVLGAGVGGVLAAPFQNITVQVRNLTNGSYLTPLYVAAHTTGQDLFETGTAASAAIRQMAEGGSLAGLNGILPLDGDTLNGAGPVPPGSTGTTVGTDSFNLVSTSPLNTQLSVVAMVLPSNDAFIGLDSIDIPATSGVYRYFVRAYDAGTEANDELIGGGAVGVPGMPNPPFLTAQLGNAGVSTGTGAAGADTNTLVHVFRGILGDNDPTGGISDVNQAIHRFSNPFALITVTVP